MKKIIVVAAIAMLSVSVYAEDVKFINADGSELGDFCIAAVESDESVSFLAKELGISPMKLDEIQCNGKPVDRFAKHHRAELKADKTQYLISVSNQSPETQLCLAALTSDEEYAAIKDSMFKKLDRVEENLKCNGMSVKEFARKYRERVAKVAVNATASR